MNKIKFDSATLEDVFEQLALGKSVKSVLDDKKLSYEGLRKLMRKKHLKKRLNLKKHQSKKQNQNLQ